MEEIDHQLSDLVQLLRMNPLQSELVDELESLEAILGKEMIQCKYLLNNHHHPHSIRLTILLDINPSTQYQLLIILPDQYPSPHSSPQVHLVSKHSDLTKIAPQLFQQIHRIPQLHLNHQLVVLYDIILSSKEILERFHLEHPSLHSISTQTNPNQPSDTFHNHPNSSSLSHSQPPSSTSQLDSIRKNKLFLFHSSLPILDRKSTFIAHAISLSDPNQVPLMIQELLDDKKLSKASHNIVAWRCEFNASLHQDCDDDGETAAGSRVLHLLSLLNLKNVFVCVSRWFGGIHLGPDRFKHINQAARDALIVGGFIPFNQNNNNKQSKKSLEDSKKKNISKSH